MKARADTAIMSVTTAEETPTGTTTRTAEAIEIVIANEMTTDGKAVAEAIGGGMMKTEGTRMQGILEGDLQGGLLHLGIGTQDLVQSRSLAHVPQVRRTRGNPTSSHLAYWLPKRKQSSTEMGQVLS